MDLYDDVWLLDSGTSVHMTFIKDFSGIWKNTIIVIIIDLSSQEINRTSKYAVGEQC